MVQNNLTVGFLMDIYEKMMDRLIVKEATEEVETNLDKSEINLNVEIYVTSNKKDREKDVL